MSSLTRRGFGRAATRRPDRHAIRVRAQRGVGEADGLPIDRCSRPLPPLRGGPAAPGSGSRGDLAFEQSHPPGPREGEGPERTDEGLRMSSPTRRGFGRAATRKPDRHAIRIRAQRGVGEADGLPTDRCSRPLPPLRGGPAAPGSGSRGDPAFEQSHPPGPREGEGPERADEGLRMPPLTRRGFGRAATRKPDRHAIRIRAQRGVGEADGLPIDRCSRPLPPLRSGPAAPGSGSRGDPAFEQSHPPGPREGEGPEQADAFRPAGG